MSHSEAKNSPQKYAASGDYQQLQVALIGTCINPGSLTGSARARSDGNNNLAGITQDGALMYKYFIENGARISLYEFTVPALPGATVKQKLFDFVQQPGNNKLLFITGHGDKEGAFVAGTGVHVSPLEVIQQISQSRICGLFTIVVDTCFAGMWAKTMLSQIEQSEQTGAGSSCLQPLQDAARKDGKCVFINMRLACLPFETSGDTDSGGRYTTNIQQALMREWSWIKQSSEPGWGTQALNSRIPDSNNDVVWTIGKSERQSDITIDFVYNPAGKGHWKWYTKEDRQKYLGVGDYSITRRGSSITRKA